MLHMHYKGNCTEILLLKPPYIIYMRTCNAESQKGQQKVQICMKTTVIWHSMLHMHVTCVLLLS